MLMMSKLQGLAVMYQQDLPLVSLSRSALSVIAL